MELSICSQDGQINLYFVIPENGTVETCSNILVCAYQACREQEFNPIWIESKECLTMKPTKKDVFIIDPFIGVHLEYFISGSFKSGRVFGPRVILSSLHNKTSIPELPYPLHNTAMNKMVITSTGFEKTEKAELVKLVNSMSGIYSYNFHEGITHLLCKIVGSRKYMVAIERDIPIMTGEWVKAVWMAAHQESGEFVSAANDKFVKFSCPVFLGLDVCVSQMPRADKDALKKVITENGGTYSANLDMSSTSILILNIAEGEKYTHAKNWHIPCLRVDWVYDSIECGHSMPMDEYKLQATRHASSPIDDKSMRAPPDLSICSTIMNMTAQSGEGLVDETADSMDVSIALKKPLPPINRKVSEGVAHLKEADLQMFLKAGMFLDGCKIFLSGFDGVISEKLRRILNSGGATRYNQLTEAVSHMVIGKILNEHFNIINSLNTKPLILTADWLIESAKKKQLIDETPYLFAASEASSPNESIISHKKLRNQILKTINETSAIDNEETFVDEALMMQYMSGSGQEITRGVKRKCADWSDDAECSTLPDSQVPYGTSSALFYNLLFTISGYDEENESDYIDAVCSNGGRFVDLNYNGKVNYSIVTMNGGGIAHKNAMHIVTHIFVEECLENERLMPIEYFFLPIRWPYENSPLEDCVLGTSNYVGKERVFLINLSKALGAIFQEMFARNANDAKNVMKSTHLCCPNKEGNKYKAAKKWGMSPITCDWLLECARQNQLIGEHNFAVDNEERKQVDGTEIMMDLYKMSLSDVTVENAEESVYIAPTPINRKVMAVKNQSRKFAEIHTPDIETMRRMYPTPGRRPGAANDSLEGISTPETPYGQTWDHDPTKSTRKRWKKVLNSIPDPDSSAKPSPGTPSEVYIDRFFAKCREANATRGHTNGRNFEKENFPKMDDLDDKFDNVEHSENRMDIDEGKEILKDVILFATQKITDLQKDLFEMATRIGAGYRYIYDRHVITHVLHASRTVKDTNQDFKKAKEHGKFIVAPEWVYACCEEGKRVDELLYPHTHNPKLSLSLSVTKDVNAGCKKENNPSCQINETQEQNQTDKMKKDCESPKNSTFHDLSKKLEELEAQARVSGGVNRRNSARETSNGRRISIHSSKNTHSKPVDIESIAQTETESQGTAITWDDPQERLARAIIDEGTSLDTQEILKENFKRACGISVKEKNDAELKSRSSYIFSLSGMTEEQIEYYSEIITNLGGQVSDIVKSYHPSWTHLLSMKPTRSERHLAAIASGKWILYYSYLEASKEVGHFIEETEHEWGNPNSSNLPILEPNTTESKIASAAYRWRVNYAEMQQGAFFNMKALIFCRQERLSAFTRLVEAGGGEVLCLRPPYGADTPVTHCFAEPTRCNKVDMAAFAALEIPVLPPLYLNDIITMETPPDEMESCITEYKQILLNLTSDQSLKRRSTRIKL